jgi:hypothetical protein
MSKQRDSNVIKVDFSAKRVLRKEHGTQCFSSLIEKVIGITDDHDEWPEDLTPRERSEQLRKDLDFLRTMNEFPAR